MARLRRNRKSLAVCCLGLWSFAFVVGVAHACSSVPAAHELETLQPSASHGQTDDGDDIVGCNKSCLDGAPLADLPSMHGFFGTQALIVQTRTDTLAPSIAVRGEAANHRSLVRLSAPPRLRNLRLTL